MNQQPLSIGNPQLNSASALNRLAENCYARGKLSEAIALCHRAIKTDPYFTQSYLNLAHILATQGKIAPAIRADRQAVAIDPYCQAAYAHLGQLFQKQGQFERAIAAYLEVLAIQPDCQSAYSELADLLRQIGRPNDARLCQQHKLPVHVLEEFYQHPRPWSILVKSDPQLQEVTSQQIHPATQIQLSPPKTLSDRIYPAFKLTTFEYFPTEVAQVANGRAWADYHTLAFLTASNQLLLKFGCGSSELIAASAKLPAPVKIAGTVAFLSVRWGTTYFHWMTDLLPRIELLRLAGIDLAKIDKFVVNRYQLAYEKATLAHFGIGSDRIVESCQTPHIQADRLLIPYVHYRGANWAGQFLRQEFLNDRTLANLATNHSSDRRIYISRQSARYRRIVNEAELVSCLTEKFGFKSIALETMSFAEQVATMAAAEVVVAPHGAGLTNLVFCRPGTKAIEIFSPHYINGCYWLLSHQVPIDYYYLLGKDEPGTTNLPTKSDRDPDIWVDIDRLIALLELANISPV